MSGYMSFPEILAPFIESGQCKINVGDLDIRFSNGAAIHLRHVQHDSDVTKYQGAEIHLLLMDELTHFSEYVYRFLRSRVRLGGLKIPKHWEKKLPGIISATNPGSSGHQWVKRMFVDGAIPDEIRQMPPEEGGMRRQFIPAKITDNPTLMKNDPLYLQRLEGLGSPDLVRAMREGNWDIVAGAALEKLHRSTHMIRSFKPLDHWTKFMSIDWGTAKPYSIGWYCVPDEDVVLAAKNGYKEMLVPKNSIIRYRELYGWNGKPDEGCREESWQVAQKILAMEADAVDMFPDIEGKKNMLDEIRKKKKIEKIDYRIGDSAMWAQHDGPSVAENMAKNGVILEPSHKDRAANYLEFRSRISPAKGNPGFFVTENCIHFWRTVPELQLDERKPESGPDTRQEDHCVISDTVLLFKDGPARIGDKVHTTGEVWTPLGWRKYKKCRLTQKDAEIVNVYVGKKKFLTCTPNHKILTERGWREAKDCVGEIPLLSIPKHRHSWEDNINLLKNIERAGGRGHIINASLKEKLFYYIEWFGRLIKEKSQKDSISIILMEMFQITRLKISNVLMGKFITENMRENLVLNTLKSGKTQEINIIKKVKENFSRLIVNFVKKNSSQQNIAFSEIGNFVRTYVNLEAVEEKNLKSHQGFLKKKLYLFVHVANRLFKRIGGILSSVPKNVKTNIIVTSVEPAGKSDVYCMEVEEAHCFVLENGLIVHNCYDEVAYSLISRPMTWTKKSRYDVELDASRRKAFDAERGGVVGRYKI